MSLRKRTFWWFLKGLRPYLGPSKPLAELKNPQKILVVSCTALGDTLLSVPAIRAVRELFPRARLVWFINSRFYPLFKRYKGLLVDDFLLYPGRYRGLFRLYRRIRQERFDLTLSFHDSDHVPVGLSYLARVPFILRSALKDETFVPFLSTRTPYRDEAHSIEQRLDVVRLLLNKNEHIFETRLFLPLHPEEMDFVRNWLREKGLDGKKLIGFQCRASRPYREWPLERFKELAALLKKDPEIRILLLGSAKDRSSLRALEDERVLNLAGEIPLEKLPALIKEVTLLVSVDTGPMHLAFAVGTPVVGLFCPSNVHHTGPYQDFEKHRLIVKPKPCDPCLRKYCPKPWCMALISVEEVFEAVKGILLENRLSLS